MRYYNNPILEFWDCEVREHFSITLNFSKKRLLQVSYDEDFYDAPFHTLSIGPLLITHFPWGRQIFFMDAGQKRRTVFRNVATMDHSTMHHMMKERE